MKTKLLSAVFLLASIIVFSQTTVAIPDAAFEAYLETEFADNITPDGSSTDGSITFTDIDLVTDIDLPTAGITDVTDITGVKSFIKLKNLYVQDNALTGTLDVSEATLKGVYYGEEEVIITKNFSLITDPNEPRYYKHTDVLLSARSGYGGTEDAFFDAETGAVYNSCSAFENRTAIDFFIYDQSGYVQLYGPHNATNTVKNFKCNNVTIDPQDGSWNDFYGAGGIETKFRALNRANPDELRVIEAYEAGTIIELNSELFNGIELPTTSAPRVYKSSSDAGFDASSGHFSLDEYSIGWVRNFSTGKNGIIKVKQMPKDAVNGRIPELIFDIIWAK